MNTTEERATKAAQRLALLLPPLARVYTILRETSRSGQTRLYSVLTVSYGEITDITNYVAAYLDMPQRDELILVRGTGFDGGFHIIEGLMQKLNVKLLHDKL